MLPTELDETLASLEFENSGEVAVAGVRWRANADAARRGWECRVELAISYGGTWPPRERWEVRCARTWDNRFSDGPAGDVELLRDHILLAPYRGSARLFFRGRPTDARVLLADLWARHQEVTNGWFPFEHFLNPGMPAIGFALADLLASSGGILAEGPTLILREYAAVLERHGVNVSLLANTTPRKWLHGNWEDAPLDAEVLIVGSSYLVGEGFTIRRVPDE